MILAKRLTALPYSTRSSGGPDALALLCLPETRMFASEKVRISTSANTKEIINPPREWVERVFNVARWTEMPVGGHFAALEQPRALALDIHEAFRAYR